MAINSEYKGENKQMFDKVKEKLRRENRKKFMSSLMRKQTIFIGKNNDADQLHSNCEADQRLCFRYSESTIPLLLKS